MAPYSPSATTDSWTSRNQSGGPECADSTRVLWFLTGLLTEFGDARNVPIHSSPYTVGRRHDQHLCLDAATVSAQHAQITNDVHRLLISDSGSTNGTYVNGHRIQRVTELKEGDLVHFAQMAFRVSRQSAEIDAHTRCEHMRDQALSLLQFDKLMNERAVIPHYQPIVDMGTLRVVGQEVLARSRIYGLEMPLAMFQAAAQLDLAVEISRMFRWEGIRRLASLPDPPLLFVNTHPREIATPGLIDSLKEIRKVTHGSRS